MRKFHDFLHRYRSKNLEDPKWIPVTLSEITDITTNYQMVEDKRLHEKNRLFGVELWTTPYAPEIRERTLSMPMDVLSESAEIDPMALEVRKEESWALNRLFYKLRLRCVTDTTEIKITHEWDMLGWLKKALRMTKWWPVKTKTAVIEGKVLYPYLKVSLPANRHTVRFALKP